MYRIVFTKQAVKDSKNLKASGLSDKARELIDVIREEPFRNPPPYEGLVGNLDGFYSRRINIKHRLVYQVFADEVIFNGVKFEGIIKVVRMWTHYDGMK